MKISPISALGATVGAIPTGTDAPQTMSQRIRSLKMNTNATPGRIEEPPPEPALAVPDVVEPTPEVEANQPLSPQFAALAKQKRALQQERAQLDKEKAELAGSADSVPLAKLKSNAMRTLLELGIPYEQLTQEILADQNGYNPEVQELKAKLAALEAGFDKKLTDRDSQAEQTALKEMEHEAVRLSSQGDDFEMIRETRSVPDVVRLIEQTYRKTGEVLDVREAMGLIEEELIKDGLRLANLKKVQSKFAPAQPVPQPVPQQQRQMRTLTNRDTASVPLSRKARALAAWNNPRK